ncbi:MAG: helix-loop-helix DNA-binding domain-containing protein [Benjaminiella poitrasii]|nr:MAG: helix-loop-helix DNA-binding domain-containing protein [Benjaminiella poitrasii]
MISKTTIIMNIVLVRTIHNLFLLSTERCLLYIIAILTKIIIAILISSMKHLSHHVLGGMVNYPEQHYFPFDSNHYKQMAGSAPSNMNLHGYPFNNGSDDMISIANSQQSPTSTNLMMFSDNNSNNEFLEDNGNNNIEDYTTQANMQAIMEKRRRRRESHNAVERRRRDNINERIQELGTLLPENVDDGINRMNKGTILRKSVEQIRKLQNDIIQYQHRIRELEVVLQQIRQNSQQHGTTTTATILRN